jgi:hypothetical protein
MANRGENGATTPSSCRIPLREEVKVKTLIGLLLAAMVAVLFTAGCGGSSGGGGSSVTNSSPFNGIYRTSFTRGTSAVTIYLNYPSIEIVVTDEAGSFPSYFGSSASGVTTVNGVLTFTDIPLAGSDGETSSASGTFGTSTTGTAANAVNLTVTGGLGYTGQIPVTSTTTNSLYTGTYGGSFKSSYTAAGVTTTPAAGSVTTLTLSPDTGTGGYDMSATGTTTDPTGVAVSFAITDAQVDPAGVISNLSVTFTYSNGTAPVTNSYGTGYLNLGVQATTQLIGYLQATSTGWGSAPVETDYLNLSQTSTTALKIKTAAK